MDEFIKSHTPRKHIHKPGYLDYLQILKRIPKDWQNKIKQNTALPKKNTIEIYFFFIQKKMARLEHCRGAMQRSLPYFCRKITPQCQWNKYEEWQQQNYTQKLTQ